MQLASWFDLLKELCVTPGVSGFEEKVAQIVRSNLDGVVDHVEKDQMGNVYGVRNSSSRDGPNIMVTAHMDEVGLIVRHIEDSGFVRVQRLGGVPENVLLGQRVTVWGTRGPIIGLIGQKPAHIMSESEKRTVPPMQDLYVDVGTEDRKGTQELGVAAGTPITYDRDFRQIGKEYLTSKALDNRVGVTVMLQAARKLSQMSLEATVHFVGTVQEEVGLRGAKVATSRVVPDVALVIDGLHAGGTPDVTDRELPMRLGCGPAITMAGSSQSGGFIGNKKLRELIAMIAEAERIRLQYNLGIGMGVSDSAAIHLSGRGVATSDILVLRRYSHSPIEMVSMRDIEDTIKLVTSVVPELDRKFVMSLRE